MSKRKKARTWYGWKGVDRCGTAVVQLADEDMSLEWVRGNREPDEICVRITELLPTKKRVK